MEAIGVHEDVSELAKAMSELCDALLHGGASVEQVRQLAAFVRSMAGLENKQD